MRPARCLLPRIGPSRYEREMLMIKIRRLGTGVAFFMCLAIASWAMWTTLGAAFDSDWLQVARTMMLWTAAVGTAYLCLVPPQRLCEGHGAGGGVGLQTQRPSQIRRPDYVAWLDVRLPEGKAGAVPAVDREWADSAQADRAEHDRAPHGASARRSDQCHCRGARELCRHGADSEAV
jgi:hypothetical protein